MKKLVDTHLDSFGCWMIGICKFLLAGIITLIFRLITPALGLHNVSPLMATELVGAKAYGSWIAGLYGFLGMIFLDLCMNMVGPWTFTTATCYGIVAIASGYYMTGKPVSRGLFLKTSIVGTLFFDLVTGIILAPLYGMPMLVAAAGQVEFTLYHIMGNCVFALLAPWFYWNVIGNPTPEMSFIFRNMPQMRARFVILGLSYARTQAH